MLIGVPDRAGEPRVALVPDHVQALADLGHAVMIERGAGVAAGYPDEAYAAAGATLTDRGAAWLAEIVVTIDPPQIADLEAMRSGSWLIAQLAPATAPSLLAALAAHDISALALDAVPRISRAQSLDVLSSMTNLAGYRAVIEAAHAYGGMFTGQVTAAGKLPPARVFVVGAGVAGLAAIGAAGSLGAEVYAFDVRPEVAEQVESMGARFVHAAGDVVAEGRGGYAGELSGASEEAARRLYREQTSAADIVITTALIPGRPAPRLIDAEAVASMHPGSVIVDVAAASGGNVAGTIAGERVETPNGVTILGWTDLAARMPMHASRLFGTNVVNLLRLLTPAHDGVLVVDADDDVQRGMTVVRDGVVTWPPPPVAVSAAPGGAVAVPPTARPPEPASAAPAPRGARRALGAALAAVLLVLLTTVAPPSFVGHLTVLALAVVVGFYVISSVTHALHTPLMSVTNAISGIILVGAVLQVGSDNLVVMAISLAGIAIASVNIFGGFLVTHRMLGMFKKG